MIAPTSKPNSDNLYAGLILLFALVLGYVLYSSAIFPVAVEEPVVQVARDEMLSKIDSINLNFSIFDLVSFKQLKIFGLIPVKPGETGRDDPFAPF